ncbi:MAG: hypothetical protein AMXMBFR7_29450 [Planctomycetota bacterium]
MQESAKGNQIRACKEHLRTLIARAELPEGAPLDEVDLRRETGATVRAVRAALSELAREGVIVRKRHVGTFVAGHLPEAHFPVLPKLRSVGILTSRGQGYFTSSEYGIGILRGIELALHQPAQVTFFTHGERKMGLDDLPPVDVADMRRACQGVVAVEATHSGQLNEFARGVPLVAVDFAPAAAAFDAVEIDHFQAGYLAARHLLALGHRRVAYIGEGPLPESTDPSWQQRLNGYIRALVEAGLPAGPDLILDVRRSVPMVQSLLPEFHRRVRPGAYVVANCGFVEPIVRVLSGLGVAVPNQVSLAAADSSNLKAGALEISQVRADYEMLGRQALRLLAARMACKAMPPVKRVQPVTFQPAQTSAAAQ